MKHRETWPGVAALLLICLFLGSVGCKAEPDRPGRGGVTQLVEPENALSEELMVSLGQAQNFHHKANVLLDDGKIQLAAAEVEKILAIPFPEKSPEAEDVLLDTRARLAKLWLMLGKMDEAMKLVDEGLKGTSRRSFFLANLHTVRGQILEAQAAGAEAGSTAKTNAARAAIDAFDTSIEINNELLEILDTGSQP